VTSTGADLRPDLPPAYHVTVTTRGPWWTAEDPSLHIPRPAGGAVRIWSAGDGPSLLLVPEAGCDHDAWAPASALLRGSFTLHAVDRPVTGFADDVDHLRTAADAVGARYLAGWAGDVAVLGEAAAGAASIERVLALQPGSSSAPGPAASPPVEVVPVSASSAEELTAGDAALVVRYLRPGTETG
jgi:pimeloyl-ACP methyl ester carboxylesterase